MTTLQDYLTWLAQKCPAKLVLSNPSQKDCQFKKITLELKAHDYHISQYTQTQAFHKNIPDSQLAEYLAGTIPGYRQLNAWDSDREYSLLISKKGALTQSSKPCGTGIQSAPEHNRQKNYILPEGCVVPPLVDMGVMSADGRVNKPMFDKFRQINRFLEIIDDQLKTYPKQSINIIDFGCGKSYLTFVLYYYLTQIRQKQVNIIGLDLKAAVIEKCNATALKYGYENLSFQVGDIAGYTPEFNVDMVITLHACDTATDHALFNAIAWKADLIFSAPCCQHEVNGQINSEGLALLTRHGIIKERFSALITDTIRANLLEYSGYKTQLLEFIDFAHTPKNLLIRAVKKAPAPKAARDKYLNEVTDVMNRFGLSPTLYRLLFGE